jgi:glucose dehydrogenase
MLWAAGVALALLSGVGLIAEAQTAQSRVGGHPRGAAAVDTARQLAADNEPGTWMSAGRTYDEQRYSPLTGINKANIKHLGLAWYGDVDTERGQESTPVKVDGLVCITTASSLVKP